MFYDPEKAQKPSSPLLKRIGLIALFVLVFFVGVAVGSAEPEESPPSDSQQVISVTPTATPIPVPTARRFPTPAPTPTLHLLDRDSPEQERQEEEFFAFNDLRTAAIHYPTKWKELDADGMPRTNEESQYQCSTREEAKRHTLAFRDELVRRIDANLPVLYTDSNRPAYDIPLLRSWLVQAEENLELNEVIENACQNAGW